MCPIVNVGLVTGSVTPSARQAPRTNVVLPLPSSPVTSTTSPGRSRAASSAPAASVSSGRVVSMRTRAVLLTEQPQLRRGQGLSRTAVVRRLLGLRLGPRRSQELRQPREVLAETREHRLAAKPSRRVVDRVDRQLEPGDRVLLRLAVHAGDPVLAAGEQLRGEVAERADHERLDQLDLAREVRLARLDLLELRIAV